MMRRLALALTLGFAATAAYGTPPASKPAPTKTAAAAPIDYAELAHHVGERVSVRSKLNTTRSGTLTHWSESALRLKLDNGAELEMPFDTIRQVSLAPAPAPKSGPSPSR